MDFSSFFDYPTQTESTRPEELTFLPDWSDEKWARLLAYTETRRHRAGDVLIRLGEIERSLYFVTEGRFEVLIPGGSRPELQQLRIRETRSIFGEVALLDGKPRSATVRALTDGETVRLSFDALLVFAAREPELALEFLLELGRILAIELRQATSVVHQLVR